MNRNSTLLILSYLRNNNHGCLFFKQAAFYFSKNILLNSFLFVALLSIKHEANAQVDMYAASAGTFYTHPSAQVGIFGNIINDATGGINHNNGGDVYLFRSAGTGAGNSRIYDGPSAPAFTGNYNSGGAYVRFYNWITDNSIGTNTPSGTQINTTSGQGRIQVEQEVRISNQHTFTNGIVWTPRGSWKHAYVHYDANGATYTGSSNTNHIDGYAAKTGSSAFDFPIGDGTRLRVGGISSPSNGTFKAAYFLKNPQSGTTGLSGPSAAATPMAGGLTKISSKEFWDIDGTATTQVKLTALNTVAGYSDWATDFNTYGGTDVKIAAWDAKWENIGISPAAASLNVDGSFSSTASPVNPDAGNSWGTNQPFSAFTFGVAINPIPLSVKLISFNALADECAARLEWTTTQEDNTDRFEVEQSNNGTFYHSAAIVTAINGKDENSYSVKVDQPVTSTYYRLKIIDKTGQFTYSPVQSVKVSCNPAGNYFTIFPNPLTTGLLYINFKTEQSGNANIMVFNEAGQWVMKRDIIINTGENKVKMEINNLPKGIYIIRLLTTGGNLIGQPQRIILE